MNLTKPTVNLCSDCDHAGAMIPNGKPAPWDKKWTFCGLKPNASGRDARAECGGLKWVPDSLIYAPIPSHLSQDDGQ